MPTSVTGLVNGTGPVPCPGMIIGEAPGEREEQLGMPFVGPSGVLLTRAIEEAGATRGEFYITNAYKKRPPGNRNPTQEELDEHYPYLQTEIDSVKPKFILILGKVAADYLEPGIRRHEWEESGWPKFLYTYHPAYALRRKEMYGQFAADVKKFVDRTLGR